MSGGKLKRSAVLLFYNDPSIIQNGSYLQIGRFSSGADLQYQDTIEESLIKIADKTIDLIYLKYLKAKISYVHDRRVETYPYARDAIREAVYNAIAHNCYMFGTPIQIRIEDSQIIISNRCILPEGWTVETLMQPHDSIPYNPDIANVFYRAGYIEHWGRGIEKICNACKKLGSALPEYELIGNSLRVHFKIAIENEGLNEDVGKDVGKDVGLNEKKVLELISKNPNLTASNIAETLNISQRQIERLLSKLKKSNLIERIGARKFGYWKIITQKEQ